ncbi:MAG TPA: L,D-transpeptidase family protein [Burkholderiales bacterium]|nr:L,D-transpeptidase family protein [Burkholderiales bacterium]
MRRWLLALIVSGGAALGHAAATPEDRLSVIFGKIEANRTEAALAEAEALIRDYPNFRLAHLVREDLLLARAPSPQNLDNVVKTLPEEDVGGLREEALVRLRALRERPALDRMPRSVLQLHPGQQHVLLVDSGRSRLYVFANHDNRPQLIADYYVTLGKNGVEKTREGDQKTPLGVYHVTGNLPRSKLSDFYGAGAFPINYPNEWDRRLGRSGYGIWLHGVPSDVYSRPPRASDGCIVLANADLQSVGRYVQVGLTPVIIADEIEWAEAAEVEAERASLEQAIERWRADWSSRDTERYLWHYSPRFASGKQDYRAWAAHKRRVNAAKRWIEVGIADVAMFRYPRERDFVVVTFRQDYRSDDLSNVMEKRQYWIREDGRWKILYEGGA